MPNTRRRVRKACLILSCAAIVAGCGSGEPTVPIPDGPRERTFTARLNVPGADSLGGMFRLTTIVSSALSDARAIGTPLLAAMLFPSPKVLFAQSNAGEATGSLTTNTGTVVPLSGTYSGSSFQVTGGGYAITASVSSTGTLTGSGTAPGGSTGAVAPLDTTATAPPPSNATGSYYGTFDMTTTLRSRNTTAGGALIGTCSFPVRITGNLVMNVTQVSSQSPQVTGHLDITWNEQRSGQGSCPPFTFNQNDYHGIDFDGVVTGLNPARVATYAAGPGNAGKVTRTQGFSGTVSGNTVVGTVYLMMDFATPVPEGMHYEVFAPAPSASVTLTRR